MKSLIYGYGITGKSFEKYFNDKYSNFSLTSEITHLNENGVVVKASIKNTDGFELATGIAHEAKGSAFINKTSFLVGSVF